MFLEHPHQAWRQDGERKHSIPPTGSHGLVDETSDSDCPESKSEPEATEDNNGLSQLSHIKLLNSLKLGMVRGLLRF